MIQKNKFNTLNELFTIGNKLDPYIISSLLSSVILKEFDTCFDSIQLFNSYILWNNLFVYRLICLTQYQHWRNG